MVWADDRGQTSEAGSGKCQMQMLVGPSTAAYYYKQSQQSLANVTLMQPAPFPPSASEPPFLPRIDAGRDPLAALAASLTTGGGLGPPQDVAAGGVGDGMERPAAVHAVLL